MTWGIETPFQALALTGGGYRGLFTAKALQIIEEHLNEPIGRHFDLACGTSIGGLIALAIAFEVPMKTVVKVFEEHGEAIFPKANHAKSSNKYWDLYKHSRKARYTTEPLREAIYELIDKDAILNDALHPVAIPAVNVTQGRPQVFKTRHIQNWVRDWKLKVVDIALATSAAPTFFELAEINGSRYADGGLFANAPDLIAIHEADFFLKVPIQSIKVLSIGTMTNSYSISIDAGKNFGIADWMDNQRLFSTMISAQQQFTDQIVRHRLKDNYYRLDYEPSYEQAADLGLDIATEAARKTLLALAEKIVTDNLPNNLQQFLPHKPHLKIFKD